MQEGQNLPMVGLAFERGHRRHLHHCGRVSAQFVRVGKLCRIDRRRECR